eukprot:CAMPEP_0185580340 /NCGR_PEP_ID=MMETSP0434-20130131/16158_1 /TAXON_ID=626734 ORGANISM="Favella taraikaensis, Strain Fe Narragansett Bay" /NCGR_SAMPLE_ID=MMETSP0434 /ASSEMBLY_ACC=CAM_ASM_000379 /LENGTH=58 /DNA_ID=CAMNT_0028198571 /DNA_START=1308 /DNA_END=1484 /DNA_ORIENTATION=-
MLVPVFALNVLLAVATLVGFSAALLLVDDPGVDFEDLLAPAACTGLHVAPLFMLTELG